MTEKDISFEYFSKIIEFGSQYFPSAYFSDLLYPKIGIPLEQFHLGSSILGFLKRAQISDDLYFRMMPISKDDLFSLPLEIREEILTSIKRPGYFLNDKEPSKIVEPSIIEKEIVTKTKKEIVPSAEIPSTVLPPSIQKSFETTKEIIEKINKPKIISVDEVEIKNTILNVDETHVDKTFEKISKEEYDESEMTKIIKHEPKFTYETIEDPITVEEKNIDDDITDSDQPTEKFEKEFIDENFDYPKITYEKLSPKEIPSKQPDTIIPEDSLPKEHVITTVPEKTVKKIIQPKQTQKKTLASVSSKKTSQKKIQTTPEDSLSTQPSITTKPKMTIKKINNPSEILPNKPRIVDSVKAPKQPRIVDSVKAPKQPRIADSIKTPKQPRIIISEQETPKKQPLARAKKVSKKVTPEKISKTVTTLTKPKISKTGKLSPDTKPVASKKKQTIHQIQEESIHAIIGKPVIENTNNEKIILPQRTKNVSYNNKPTLNLSNEIVSAKDHSTKTKPITLETISENMLESKLRKKLSMITAQYDNAIMSETKDEQPTINIKNLDVHVINKKPKIVYQVETRVEESPQEIINATLNRNYLWKYKVRT